MAKDKQTNPTKNRSKKGKTTKVLVKRREEQERTTTAKARFLSVFMAKGNNISESCKAAAIARCVYYEWLHKDPDFKQAVADAKEALYDFAETSLIAAMQDGNFQAIKFFLINKAKQRGWQETTTIQQQHSGGIEIIHTYEPPPKKVKE